MLGIRRFFSRQTPRGDYDAVPLSDIQSRFEAHEHGDHSNSSSSYHRQDKYTPTLKIRKAGLTVLLTIFVYTIAIYLVSAFRHHNGLEPLGYSYNSAKTVDLTGEGGFYRDMYPIRTMLKYWEIAEREVKERGLDTCDGQLSRGLIDSYVRSELDYCHPPDDDTDETASRITCAPAFHDEFTKWWPHAISPCISSNLRPIPDTHTQYHSRSCNVTPEGESLKKEMLADDQRFIKFVGTNIEEGEAEDCIEHLNRTWIEIPRQDRWNPFHVGEDLITTMVTVLMAAQLRPELIDTRVQLVFADDYGMDANHFTPLWDRIGTWAPRRLTLDPWRKGECLGTTIHSVNARSSLLSAMYVERHYGCTSTITWAASHYYRHLVGLTSRDHETTSNYRPPINILWLSRAKYNAWAKSHNDWNSWKDIRLLENEPELMDRIRTGLSDYCGSDGGGGGGGGGGRTGTGCRFEDGKDGPVDWHVGSAVNEPRNIRFHDIDPSVLAIENQLYLVGHSTIVMSLHSGALGLTLFLPPGHGHVIELLVPQQAGMHHYDNMCQELGRRWEPIHIERHLDVDQIWDVLKKAVDDAIIDQDRDRDHDK